MTATTDNTHVNPTRSTRLVMRISQHSLHFAQQHADDAGTPLNFQPYNVKGAMSMAANLREAFKTVELFETKYRKVVVMVDAPFLVVPLDLYVEGEASMIYSHSYPDLANMKLMTNVVADLNVVALYGIHKDLHTVITDRYDDAIFFNASTPVWRHLFQRNFSGTKGKLYAYCHDQKLELMSYGQNRFKYCNSFATANAHDVLYFTLNVWQQLAMDAKHDELHLVGDIPEHQWLESELKAYVARVYTVNPSSDFNRSPIAQMKGMPYDLMTYFIKGR